MAHVEMIDDSVTVTEAVDKVLVSKVKEIMEKYANTETFTDELCDLIMEDIRTIFGKDTPAKLMIDSDTKEIEITIPNFTNKLIKFSSLELLKKED
jgi:hypothetical protein